MQKTTVLFIQGAGEGAYEADKKLVKSLQQELGTEYDIRYPTMPNEDNAKYDQWKQRIKKELNAMNESIMLGGHSVGASILLKYLTEFDAKKKISGIFLIAGPFWGGEGWHYEGYEKLALPNGFAAKLRKNAQVFLYQSTDDEIVPFEHMAFYAHKLPQATIRKTRGGHQLNNNLSIVAKDIRACLKI